MGDNPERLRSWNGGTHTALGNWLSLPLPILCPISPMLKTAPSRTVRLLPRGGASSKLGTSGPGGSHRGLAGRIGVRRERSKKERAVDVNVMLAREIQVIGSRSAPPRPCDPRLPPVCA